MAEVDETSVIPEADEPLSSFGLSLSPGEIDSEFRTQNASPEDFERRNVIERTQTAIDIRCDLMEVSHGWLQESRDDEYATLMVLRFRFDPQKTSRRLRRVRINIEFLSSSADRDAPQVFAIAPEERWSVAPTVDQEEVVRGAELHVAASGIPFVDGGVNAKLLGEDRHSRLERCDNRYGFHQSGRGEELGPIDMRYGFIFSLRGAGGARGLFLKRR